MINFNYFFIQPAPSNRTSQITLINCAVGYLHAWLLFLDESTIYLYVKWIFLQFTVLKLANIEPPTHRIETQICNFYNILSIFTALERITIRWLERSNFQTNGPSSLKHSTEIKKPLVISLPDVLVLHF